MISLFAGEFRKHTGFGLAPGGEGVEFPDPIECDSVTPIHLVHSDPDYLAYLVGLMILQAWTYGIEGNNVPIELRRPVLLATESPGGFGEAYLRLRLPVDSIESLCRIHRVRLFETLGRVPNATVDKSGYWDYAKLRGEWIDLHDLFPAHRIITPDGKSYPISRRHGLGRGDTSGPAVLIARTVDNHACRAVQSVYDPLVTIVDARRSETGRLSYGHSTFVYHDSLFAPELPETGNENAQIVCLPDLKFERFCSGTSVSIVGVEQSSELNSIWGEIDSALQCVIDEVTKYRSSLTVGVRNTALRLRNVLLGLPVGIEQYEQGLVVAGIHQSIYHDWSVSELLQSLEGRAAEMRALGEWAGLVMETLLGGFKKLAQILAAYSPKEEALLEAVRSSSGQGFILVSNHPVAQGIKWGLKFSRNTTAEPCVGMVPVISPEEMSSVPAGKDCIIHQAFDPYRVFPRLVQQGPCSIKLVLFSHELRFLRQKYLRIRQVFPSHMAAGKLLDPICRAVDAIAPAQPMDRDSKKQSVYSQAEYGRLLEMFEESQERIGGGVVLSERPDDTSFTDADEVDACLVKLESEKAVLLEPSARVSYVAYDDVVSTGTVSELRPGNRLIIVNPTARESIVQKILSARLGKEMTEGAGQVIAKWQEEITEGIRRSHLTNADVLVAIRQLGSERISVAVIGQWARGDVLGPLDAHDIARVGKAVGSEWLVQNWQKVGVSLYIVRSGHRTLGHQITRILQKAAVGDHELSAQDQEVLLQIGISVGEIQDATSLLKVDFVSTEAKPVATAKIGKIVSLQGVSAHEPQVR